MKRLHIFLLTASLALASCAAPAVAQAVAEPEAAPGAANQPSTSTFALSSDSVDRLTVQADHLESTLGGSPISFSGNVHAEIVQRAKNGAPQPPIIITADTLSADFALHTVTAEQRVAVESRGHVVRGDSATYNWAQQVGRVNAVYATEYGLNFRAGWVDVGPQREVMHDVVFSACGLERPDYAIHASAVALDRNRRIVAYGPSLEMFGHTLIRLPRIAYQVRQGRADTGRAIPVPRPGYSRTSGATVSQTIPLAPNVTAEAEITTRVGLRGMLDYRQQGRVTPFVNADWKQERPSRERTSVLVSRLPEAGILFGRKSEASISVGYFREHTTHVSARRANAAFTHTLIDRGEHTGLRLIAGGRISTYSTGDTYRAAQFEVSVGRDRPKADVFETVGVRENGLTGHTPFQWDEVLIQSEIFAGKRIAWGSYRLEGGIRYDAGRREIYDQEYAVARMLRCVEPEVRYSTRRKALFVSMRLIGR